jgi:hypothetical protein
MNTDRQSNIKIENKEIKKMNDNKFRRIQKKSPKFF